MQLTSSFKKAVANNQKRASIVSIGSADSPFSSEGTPSFSFRNIPTRNDSRRRSSVKNDGSRRSSVKNSNKRSSVKSTASIAYAHTSSDDDVHNPIIVTIRVRPTLRNEAGMEDAVTCARDGQTLLLEIADKSKQVTVDKVIDSRSGKGSQQEFYDQVGRSLVMSSLKDYNICIFAYGHTGSGKTYTVLGQGGVLGPHVGLLPRFIRDLFEEHAKLPPMLDTHYSCQYYEVYNETIRDLLAPIHVHGQDRRREVRVHPKYGVRIEGLSTSVVKDTEETLDLVLFGNQMRTIATTTMNAQSSRSHCVFTFRYVSETEKEHHESVMTFVDLAGREDQAASQNKEVQFREMTYINTSLFHLSHLITKLSDGAVQRSSLADFRNSKLTLLLSHALVGNSCTTLIATIAPSKAYFEDSLSTLHFAQQVKKIKTKPIINTTKSSAVVEDLEDEIKKLRDELSIAKSSNSEIEQNLIAAQALITHYTSGREHDEASSADSRSMRRRLSSVLGLFNTEPGYRVPKTSSGDPLPFLTKLSDDSSLQGCCNYFLVKERTRIGGLRQECDVVVRGVGIKPLMCVIVLNADKTIIVELAHDYNQTMRLESHPESPHSTYSDRCDPEEDAPRVLVNGVYLTKQSHHVLEHGDAIILGYSHAFRLVVPSSLNVDMDAASMARLNLDKLDLTSAMQEVKEEGSRQYQQIYPFLPQMNTESSEATVRALLKVLNTVCPLIDEANAITREVLGIGTLMFKLHILTDLFSFLSNHPQVVVCVFADPESQQQHRQESRDGETRRNYRPRTFSCSLVPTVRTPLVASLQLPPILADGESEDLLLYVWTLEKFMRRLSEMREVYQGGSAAHDEFAAVREQLQSDPFTNPWREATFADVKLLSENARCSLRSVSTAMIETQSNPTSVPLQQKIGSSSVERHHVFLQNAVDSSLQAACAHVNDGCIASQPSQLTCSLPIVSKSMNSQQCQHTSCAAEDSNGVARGVKPVFLAPSEVEHKFLAQEHRATEFDNCIDYEMSNSAESSSLSPNSPESCFRNFLEVRRRLVELEASTKCPADKAQDFDRMLEKLDGIFDRLTSPPTFRRLSPSSRKASSRESSPSAMPSSPIVISSPLRDNVVAQRFQRRTLDILRQC